MIINKHVVSIERTHTIRRSEDGRHGLGRWEVAIEVDSPFSRLSGNTFTLAAEFKSDAERQGFEKGVMMALDWAMPDKLESDRK